MPFLLVHFTGERYNGEQIYFSISKDGYHFTDVNNGNPIIISKVGEMGLRDPFILKNKLTDEYTIVSTDLQIYKNYGWDKAQNNGSRDLVVYKSRDLINWSEPIIIKTLVDGASNAWAPEAFFDVENNKYLVYWSAKTDGKHKIYAAYTTDFITMSEPFVFFESVRDVIDSTICFENGYYYRFSKDETTKTIILQKSEKLTGEYSRIDSNFLQNLMEVEGPETYKVNGKTLLLVDRFINNQGYQLIECVDLEAGEFRFLNSEEYSFNGTIKRHGSVIEISEDEYYCLINYHVKPPSSVDGYFADPCLTKVEDKWYLYSTTDGYEEWSSNKFYVHSSDSLQHFYEKKEILNFNDIKNGWAKSHAWAPCITNKNDLFYFYYCGKRFDGKSCIGVAISKTPDGPFIPQTQPLITPELIQELGIVGISQTIDPAIYKEENQYYLIFGNGDKAVIIELEDDLLDIKKETAFVVDGLYEFTEALDIFKRNSLYHFTWSSGDTRSEDYRVNYGTSSSLFGPIEFHGTILSKNNTIDELGTGHHNIYYDEDRDEYILAYHRFRLDNRNIKGERRGFHREIVITKIEFNETGLIKPI